MYHEQPPGVAKAMEAKGLKYCPMREAWVEPRSNETPTLPSIPRPWQDLSIITPNCPAPRDYQETFLSTFYTQPRQSFLLQAPTGSGKTFTALYAAAMHLERGERVVFVVPTTDLMEQTYTEATRLFGNRPHLVRKLSGQNKKAREAAYQDPAAKLLIIVGPSCCIDMDKHKLDPASIGLLILDEGDLMRGKEPVAQIIERRKGMSNPLRTILMSATLTVADEGTPQYRAEIAELQRKTHIPNFIQLYPDAKQQSRYDITREKVRLGPDTYQAAAELQQEFVNRLDSIKGALPSLPFCTERDKLADLIDKMQKKHHESSALLLPSIKSALRLPQLLGAMTKLTAGDEQESLVKLLTRKGYEMQFLHHAHQLLVTSSRVNFLEYTSEMFFRCRSPGMAGKTAASPSEQAIFRPGLPPTWWSAIAKDTPYALVAEVSRVSVAPLERFLSAHGHAVHGHTAVAKKFFWNGSELGAAAQALSTAPTTTEHPKFDSLLAWIRGPLRKQNQGQLLVNCWTALDAKFWATRLASLTGEMTVALVGQSHTTKAARIRNFNLAKAGEASIVCGTSVVGRGVDLPKLRYLVMLDPTSDLRVAKQFFGRVGRGHDMFGSVVILATEGGPDELRDRARRQKAESSSVSFPDRAPSVRKGRGGGSRSGPSLWSNPE